MRDHPVLLFAFSRLELDWRELGEKRREKKKKKKIFISSQGI
jgi:hypothetical protein